MNDNELFASYKDLMTSYCMASQAAIHSDAVWQYLGYPKPPLRGLVFLRFRPAWKNRLETELKHEICNFMFAAYIIKDGFSLDYLAEFLGKLDDGWFLNSTFISEKNSRRRLFYSIDEYNNTPKKEWVTKFAGKIIAFNEFVPDSRIKNQLIAGSIRLSMAVVDGEFVDSSIYIRHN